MKNRPIVVTTHAVNRYRQRYRDPSATLWEVSESLKQEINEAYEARRVAKRKTKRFRLYAETKRELPANERFVYREDESMGWIVKIDGHKLVVVTTLSPAWGYSEDVA